MSRLPSYRIQNLRFSVRKIQGRPCCWMIYITRISDGHQLDQIFTERRPSKDELCVIADQWIMLKAGNDEPKPYHCTGCGSVLKAVNKRDTNCQFENALYVSFSGGYGMAIDPLATQGDSYRKLICHECFHELCDKIPWIRSLLHPYGSHSHDFKDHARLVAEGHKGQDLPIINDFHGKPASGPQIRKHLLDIHGIPTEDEPDAALETIHNEAHGGKP